MGGRTALFVANWQKVSSDPWTLETIEGYKFEFQGTPQPPGNLVSMRMNAKEMEALQQEISDLANKEAIIPVPDREECYLSPVFLVPKPDGSWRPVINLKSLNKHKVVRYFKMESIRTIKGLMQRRRLADKTGFEEHVPLSPPYSPLHQRLLQCIILCSVHSSKSIFGFCTYHR